MFSFCLNALESRPCRVVMALFWSGGVVCTRWVLCGTYRLSSDSEDCDGELDVFWSELMAEASACGASPVGEDGWLSSGLALNGVTWSSSLQSKSNVSSNPSDELSLLLCGACPALALATDRSRLLERALGLGFSQGFFNGPRSGLRPRSCFCGAGSGLERGGGGWACLLLGCCLLLAGGGSGVECCTASERHGSTVSFPARCCFWSGLFTSPGMGLRADSKPTSKSVSVRKVCCTHSDLRRLLLSARWRRTPTVEGNTTSLATLECLGFFPGVEPTGQKFDKNTSHGTIK